MITLTFPWWALAAAFPFAFYTLFTSYAAVMNLGWAKVPLLGKILLAPAALSFGVLDVAFNVTIGSAIFWQRPTWAIRTLSRRMAWNIANDKGWRAALSAAIVSLLLPFTKSY